MRLLAAGVAALAWVAAPVCSPAQQIGERLQLRFDPSEAEAVLGIAVRHRAGEAVGEGDWQRLFGTEPYQRLKRREASLQRGFTDSAFARFVLSDSLAERVPALRDALEAWKRADLTAAAARAFAYLPPDASIRAKVFVVIKPQTNSFVYEMQTDPTIFLYLDPAWTAAQFANVVAHELHHVGYASVSARGDSAIAALPPDAHAAAEWVGSFGEGFAMLAAAGSPDVNPNENGAPPATRERFAHDVANFGPDLLRVQQFLLDVATGKLKTPEERQRVGYGFFGVQGPWYTVGWKMAVTIEKQFGRAKVIECMRDPRQVLAVYNQAAARQNAAGGERLPLWSAELLRALGVGGAAD